MSQQHSNNRQQVWIQAWCAVANANDCKSANVATTWADRALKDFDNRFGKCECCGKEEESSH